METLYKALVTTERDPLRIRDAPKMGRIIGHVPRGRKVDVLDEGGDWWRIRYGETEGYASGAYLARVEEEPPVQTDDVIADPDKTWIGIESFTTLVSVEDGCSIVIGGKWRVQEYYVGGRYISPGD